MQLKCIYMMIKLWSSARFPKVEYMVRGSSIELLMQTLISQYCRVSLWNHIVELKTTKNTTLFKAELDHT